MIRRDCMLTQATQLETPGGVLDVDMEAQKALNETVMVFFGLIIVGAVQSL